jgi:hypothetical protein
LQLDEADDFFRHAFLLAGQTLKTSSPGLATLLTNLAPSRVAPSTQIH